MGILDLYFNYDWELLLLLSSSLCADRCEIVLESSSPSFDFNTFPSYSSRCRQKIFLTLGFDHSFAPFKRLEIIFTVGFRIFWWFMEQIIARKVGVIRELETNDRNF
eukprot:TCONS_00073492-protein